MSECKFEVTITVTYDENKPPLTQRLCGGLLQPLQELIIPEIVELCKNQGITTGVVFVEVGVTKDDEYYDSDDGDFDLDTQCRVL